MPGTYRRTWSQIANLVSRVIAEPYAINVRPPPDQHQTAPRPTPCHVREYTVTAKRLSNLRNLALSVRERRYGGVVLRELAGAGVNSEGAKARRRRQETTNFGEMASHALFSAFASSRLPCSTTAGQSRPKPHWKSRKQKARSRNGRRKFLSVKSCSIKLRAGDGFPW